MKKVAFLSVAVFSASVFGMTRPLDENPRKSSSVIYSISDSEKYAQCLEQSNVQLQKENSQLKEENKFLANRVKKLKKEHDIRENYVKIVEEGYNNLKSENEKLKKTVSEKNQEIKNLNKILNQSKENSEKVPAVLNLANQKEIPDDIKQHIETLYKIIQEKETVIKEISERNEELSEENDQNSFSESSISEINGVPLSEEIPSENFLEQNSIEVVKISDSKDTSNKQTSFDTNDWGLFSKETNNDEECLILKEDPAFSIKSAFVNNTFSLYHKSDYVMFGYEYWNRLVEFRLVNDAREAFPLSQSDFTNRQCRWNCLPGRLFRISSETDSLIITKDFVYKGESKDLFPHGKGVMLKNTGEVLKGKFEGGEYRGENPN